MGFCKKIATLLRGSSAPSAPTITVNSALPSLLDLSFSGYSTYEWGYDEDANFNSPSPGTGSNLSVNDLGEIEVFVRVRGTSPTSKYATQTFLLQRQQLRSLDITATSGVGIVTISHNCAADEPNVSVVSVQRRVSGVGSFVQIDTFAPTTNDYVDSTVVAETDYDYRLELVTDNATDYINSFSNIVTTAPTAPAEEFIDMEADHNMFAYYLPLDGRQYEGFDMPLSNIEPLGDGTSRITAVTNDGLGTTVNGVFDANVVGKTFVAIDAHLNGDLGSFIDEYVPNSISPRYATVTSYDVTNGAWCIVDFEYNGGNTVTPQNTLNCLSYIGYDNTAEWANVMADWQNLERPTRIIGQPISRTGYVLNAYYIREFTQVPLNIAKDFYIGTSNGSPMRIKHGVEERYRGAIDFFGGTTFWNDPDDMFLASGYNNKCVSHNVQWISAHKTYTPGTKYMADGTIGTGVFMCIGNHTKKEWDELDAGYGFDIDKLLWQMASNELTGEGSYVGSGETLDVADFGFNVHINCDYDGNFVAGATGGSTRGAHYNVFDNTTINFNPQSKFVPSSQRLNLKFTTDFSNINNTGDVFDPATHTDYLPAYAIETDGNFYRVRYMGGNSRATIIHIDRFVFPFNHPRDNQIDSYYNLCYNNNKAQTLPNSSTPVWGSANAGKYTCSNVKALVEWEIPTSGSVRTIQRKVDLKYPIAGNSDLIVGERTANPTIWAFAINAVATHINWGLILQKRAEDFTTDELSYISRVNRRPWAAQSNDTFKLLAWVEVADATGFEAGQSVTVRDAGNATITTGTIHEIDNTLFTNRIKIKGATVNISTTDNITNGTQTQSITSASDYDPEQIYTLLRRQGGRYGDSAIGVNGGGDGYGHGFAESTASRISGYNPWIWLVTPDLPEVITGAEGSNDEGTTNVIFEVEFVTSAAEVLLDEQFRPGVMTYVGIQRFGEVTNPASYQYQINYGATPKRISQVTRGFGAPYPGTTYDNRLTGFLTPFTWPETKSDPQGHAAYNRAELTWYVRMPSDWQNTPYRQFLANMGNNSVPRYAGDTAYGLEDLSKHSKGYTLIGEVTGLNRLLMAESASSRDQFNRVQGIYDNNPGYVPQYAIDEEMLPPNESPPYIPKVRAYGATASNFALTSSNSYLGNTVTDTDIANAPDLPKTVRDILTEIGEL